MSSSNNHIHSMMALIYLGRIIRLADESLWLFSSFVAKMMMCVHLKQMSRGGGAPRGLKPLGCPANQ